MPSTADNLAIARRYLHAIESGASPDELAQFFSPDAIAEIFPSRFFPQGSRADLSGIRVAAERGKKVMTGQTYTVRNALASAEQVALEVD